MGRFIKLYGLSEEEVGIVGVRKLMVTLAGAGWMGSNKIFDVYNLFT